MTTFPDVGDFPKTIGLSQPSVDDAFAPDVHFDEWLQALESLRCEPTASRPGVSLEDGDRDLQRWNYQLPDQVCSEGTLVITEHENLQADIEVSVAVIDGLFKGKITATEHVVLENHALVIGDINTPALTIRGGAIIEGRCYFEPPEQIQAPLERWERPTWQTFKLGFARVWRGRDHLQ